VCVCVCVCVCARGCVWVGVFNVCVFLVTCILYFHWGFFNLTEVFLTLTEVFPCFFLSCKANARAKLAKTCHGPHSSTLVCIYVVRLLFVLFYVLFVCRCVLQPGNNPIAVNKYYINNNYYNNNNNIYKHWEEERSFKLRHISEGNELHTSLSEPSLLFTNEAARIQFVTTTGLIMNIQRLNGSIMPRGEPAVLFCCIGGVTTRC
jgi:hypothetical protein